MKSKAEITKKLLMYQEELKKHKDNPDLFEESFTELVEHSIRLLEWVLKEEEDGA